MLIVGFAKSKKNKIVKQLIHIHLVLLYVVVQLILKAANLVRTLTNKSKAFSYRMSFVRVAVDSRLNCIQRIRAASSLNTLLLMCTACCQIHNFKGRCFIGLFFVAELHFDRYFLVQGARTFL